MLTATGGVKGDGSLCAYDVRELRAINPMRGQGTLSTKGWRMYTTKDLKVITTTT
jgi:hypothetical protein